jgi:hypothetical protein
MNEESEHQESCEKWFHSNYKRPPSGHERIVWLSGYACGQLKRRWSEATKRKKFQTWFHSKYPRTPTERERVLWFCGYGRARFERIWAEMSRKGTLFRRGVGRTRQRAGRFTQRA